MDTLTTFKVINKDPRRAEGYRIQVEDLLDVRNYKFAQIADGGGVGGSGSAAMGYRVDPDGFVTFPKIGRLYVLGMTRKEATVKVQQLYQASQLVDPLIDVVLVGQMVTVLGEVSEPGVYALERDNISLVEILGKARGFTERVAPKTLRIIRGDGPNPETIYVNLSNIGAIATKDILLQNKDVIYVGADERIVRYQRTQTGWSAIQSLVLVFSSILVLYTTFVK